MRKCANSNRSLLDFFLYMRKILFSFFISAASPIKDASPHGVQWLVHHARLDDVSRRAHERGGQARHRARGGVRYLRMRVGSVMQFTGPPPH